MEHKDFEIQFKCLEDYFQVNHEPSTINEYYGSFKNMSLNRFALICKKLRDEFKTYSHRKFPLIGDFHDMNREIVNSTEYDTKQLRTGGKLAGPDAYAVLREIAIWNKEGLATFTEIFSHFANGQPSDENGLTDYCKEYLEKLRNKRNKRELQNIN